MRQSGFRLVCPTILALTRGPKSGSTPGWAAPGLRCTEPGPTCAEHEGPDVASDTLVSLKITHRVDTEPAQRPLQHPVGQRYGCRQGHLHYSSRSAALSGPADALPCSSLPRSNRTHSAIHIATPSRPSQVLTPI